MKIDKICTNEKHTLCENNKANGTDKKKVKEFNLNKTVIILIAIVILVSAITFGKSLQQGKVNNFMTNEGISETKEEDIQTVRQSKKNFALTRANSKDESYIFLNSNTVSLRERGKTMSSL